MKRHKMHEKLEYLSRLDAKDYPFITLYIDADFQHSLDKSEQTRIYIKNCIHEKEKQYRHDKEKMDCLHNDTEKILSYLSDELEPDVKGVAIFACSKFGVFEVIKSSERFENECRINHAPYLNQLAHKAEETENTLIIMTDRRFSRIMELSTKNVLFEEDHAPEIHEILTHNEVHGFHKKGDAESKANYNNINNMPRTGGWAQKRYQRGIKFQIDQHYKETAKMAIDLYDKKGGYDKIVLIGQDFEIKNFMRHLPERMLNKVCSMITMSVNADHGKVITEVEHRLEEEERKQELEMVKRAINNCFANNGHYGFGIETAADCAKDGRINTLIVPENLAIKGYKLGGYYYAEENEAPEAIAQKAEEHEFDLVSEAIRLTIQHGGEVEFIKTESEAEQELRKYDKVGAILRY